MIIVPCISVRQPWAWAITHPDARKNIENRSRRFNYRGPLLIHSGKLPVDDFEGARNEIIDITGQVAEPPWRDEMEYGGIVGACVLTGCGDPGPGDGAWRQTDCFALELDKQIRLPFRAYKGALGLFKVEITATEQKALRAAGILPK